MRLSTLCDLTAWGLSSEVSGLSSKPQDPGSIPGAAILNRSFILATSATNLITVVPACLLGLTLVKVTLNSLIHDP